VQCSNNDTFNSVYTTGTERAMSLIIETQDQTSIYGILFYLLDTFPLA